MKLVDTSVAVDHLRGHRPAVALLERLVVDGEELLASELTRYELVGGVRDTERQGLSRFFNALGWIPITAEIAEFGGELARQHRRRHTGIDDIDFLIAATALALDAELLTTNVRHFPMIDRLRAPY